MDCLIHDCSQPEGLGLNDYATQEFTIKYQTVKDACKLIQPNSYMVKVDLKSAYRSVPLHPSQYQYTGLKWTFTGSEKSTYLVDTRLPFGARLSPSHFHRLTQSMRRMMERRNFQCIVYLDDFFVSAPSFEECQTALNCLITLLRSLGFSIAWQKVVDPTQCLTFLGIEIDSKTMTLHLPNDKVFTYKELLQEFLMRSRASGRQLQQLAGKLSWASHVVKGGRIYQQRVLDLLRPLRRNDHKVRLGEEFKKDIIWWLSLLEHTNSCPILPPELSIAHVYADASQTGAGIVTQDDWEYIDWNLDMPHVQEKHINIKETLAIVAAVYRWAHKWRGHNIIVYTDNITARAAINKGRCKDKEMMCHIRNLFWLSHFLNFSITCMHIPGVTNVQADCVSR